MENVNKDPKTTSYMIFISVTIRELTVSSILTPRENVLSPSRIKRHQTGNIGKKNSDLEFWYWRTTMDVGEKKTCIIKK